MIVEHGRQVIISPGGFFYQEHQNFKQNFKDLHFAENIPNYFNEKGLSHKDFTALTGLLGL